MSSGLDLSQFYETFFDEADELLAQMEQLLLELDVGAPDIEQLNAIFRAAHSIKGGAATFGCFNQLAGTTHLLENLLDAIRRGEMALRTDMIDIFLETKDVVEQRGMDIRQPGHEPVDRKRQHALRWRAAADFAVQTCQAVVAEAGFSLQHLQPRAQSDHGAG